MHCNVIFIFFVFYTFYTSEDLKWDAPTERYFKSLMESDP
jgi:hypothetical protein